MVGLSIAVICIVIFSFFLADNPWLQAFSVVPALAIPSMLILGYWFRIQESLKRLALLENGILSLTVDESSITVESAIGKSAMKWLLFSELWEFPTNYLLLYSNHQFITLPKDQITPDLINFIRGRLKAPRIQDSKTAPTLYPRPS